MANWNIYEPQNFTLWNLSYEDYITVPHDGVLSGDQLEVQCGSQKGRCDVEDFVENNMRNAKCTGNSGQRNNNKAIFSSSSSLMDGKPGAQEYSWSDAVESMFTVTSDADCMNQATLPLESPNASTNFPDTPNFSISGTNFCLAYPTRGDTSVVDESNFCSFSLDVSTSSGGFVFLDDQSKDIKDELESHWLESLDTCNCEDPKKTYRDEDLASGLRDNGYKASGLSSSGPMTEDVEHNYRLGQSSQSGLITRDTLDQHNDASMTIWLDADGANGVDHVSQGKVNEQSELSKNSYVSGGKKKVQAAEYTSSTSSHFPNPSMQNTNEKCHSPIDSASEICLFQVSADRTSCSVPHPRKSLYSQHPHVEINYHNHHGQIPVMDSTGCFKFGEHNGFPYNNSTTSLQWSRKTPDQFLKPLPSGGHKLEAAHLEQHLPSRLGSGWPSQSSINGAVLKNQHKQNNQVGDGGELWGSFQHSRMEHLPEALPGCENISLVSEHFQQLRHAMDQMDARTKLCIRDVLYRLARSAEERHSSFMTGRLTGHGNSFLDKDEPKNCPGIVDVETYTNAIDRYVAQLLFH